MKLTTEACLSHGDSLPCPTIRDTARIVGAEVLPKVTDHLSASMDGPDTGADIECPRLTSSKYGQRRQLVPDLKNHRLTVSRMST